MSKQAGKSPTRSQHPPFDGRDSWDTHWQALGWPWRTEPEIDEQRQAKLAKYCAIVPDIKKGIYPFKDVKLSRADIEWLLARHENGHGTIDWSGVYQHKHEGLDLRGADLRQVDLHGLPLICMRGGLWTEWIGATLEQRDMARVNLENANLSSANLEGAYLSNAYLERANLRSAHLEKADLYKAHLEGADLSRTHLEGTSLRGAFFDVASNINEASLGNEKLGFALLADVHWDDVNLSVVDWTRVKMLGDENEAQRPKRWDGEVKKKDERIGDYRMAVRAYRQLAVKLQAQGLNEESVNFAYRAQLLQRVVFWKQRKFGQYLFSLFRDLLAGYGYRPERSFLAYLLVIVVFMVTYHVLSPQLAWKEALVVSMTAFHGRGFFFSTFSPSDPLAFVSAIEALVGLIIEVTFIATLTQRFFGR